MGPNPIKLVTTTLHPLKRAEAVGCKRGVSLFGFKGFLEGGDGWGTASWHKNWIKRNFKWTTTDAAMWPCCCHLPTVLHLHKKKNNKKMSYNKCNKTRTRLQSNCDIIKLTTTDTTTTTERNNISNNNSRNRQQAMARATVAPTPLDDWHQWPS